METPIFLNQVAEVGIGGAIRRGVQTRNGVEEVSGRHGDKTLRHQFFDRDRAGRSQDGRDQSHFARRGAPSALLRAEDSGGCLRGHSHPMP